MFAAIQGFVSPESFILNESIMILAMVVLGGMGNIWGVIAGAVLLSFMPELLRYTVEPVQKALFGRMLVDPEVLRMLLFGLALVLTMRFRPAGLWPETRHRKRELDADREMTADPARSPQHRQALRRRAGLKDVSLTIQRGEIYGLIGPNGAGKTTLFNVFTGLYPRDGGEVVFAGAPLRLESPHQVAAAGIARTFQNIRLFGNMTARENVMVGRHVRTRAGVFGAMLRTRAERAEEAAIRRRADELLHYVGIADRADDLARNLSYGDQRRLEIARALATEPQLLALDEPAAGMNATETAGLRELIEGLRRDGVTVLLIEHDVKLVMGLCDRVAVLDHGEKIAEDVPDVGARQPESHRGLSWHSERSLKP
jgi:branched-chain amino acid transport system ATP-binding protein